MDPTAIVNKGPRSARRARVFENIAPSPVSSEHTPSPPPTTKAPTENIIPNITPENTPSPIASTDETRSTPESYMSVSPAPNQPRRVTRSAHSTDFVRLPSDHDSSSFVSDDSDLPPRSASRAPTRSTTPPPSSDDIPPLTPDEIRDLFTEVVGLVSADKMRPIEAFNELAPHFPDPRSIIMFLISYDSFIKSGSNKLVRDLFVAKCRKYAIENGKEEGEGLDNMIEEFMTEMEDVRDAREKLFIGIVNNLGFSKSDLPLLALFGDLAVGEDSGVESTIKLMLGLKIGGDA